MRSAFGAGQVRGAFYFRYLEAMSDLTLQAQALTRHYGRHAAVRAASFELRQGEVLGFLGPNGAGKTTTMQMLTGNLAPSEGAIHVCGVDLLERPKQAKSLLGYLPETPPLYREFTVDEYLAFAASLRRVARAEQPARVSRAKRRCGLKTAGGKLIGALSKGYQQRVGIAQAIVHNPQVVILDEPTAGLDPIQIREIRGLIRELGGEHSVILSTHILAEVEAICDRVQIMHQGKLVYSDTIANLNRLRRHHRLLVGLRRPPAPAELLAIPGITQATPNGADFIMISFDPANHPVDTLVKTAVEKSWGLFHLSPPTTNLEEIFVQLTQNEHDD